MFIMILLCYSYLEIVNPLILSVQELIHVTACFILIQQILPPSMFSGLLEPLRDNSIFVN